MNALPRIAVGTIGSTAERHVILCALLNVLERSGVRVQLFSSQSRFEPFAPVHAATGQGRRHLDSWLMPPEVCAELFYHAARCADLGLVEGEYDAMPRGGSLSTLCDWLDIPKLVVVDAAQGDPCRVPILPPSVDGILLDKVANVERLSVVQTTLESLYGVPVLGWLGELPYLRRLVAGDGSRGGCGEELCEALGNELLPRLKLSELWNLATRRSFPPVADDLFRLRDVSRPPNIAVAFDEAFCCYFPDTLDVLESQGAAVSVFSPLRGECLPPETDVVYFGCGRPEDYVAELASNFCMKEALWNHVASGGRVYAESAGLAYLCREVVMPSGQRWPMVGLLPALARRNPQPTPDEPVEMTMARGCWLFGAQDRVRGYLSSKWIIHPEASLLPLVSGTEHSHDLVAHDQVVGSRVHLNFAARPEYVGQFFLPGRRRPLKTVP